jgi:hypothetical protein
MVFPGIVALVRAVSYFDGLMFAIGDGPSAIVTAAFSPRSLLEA